MPGSLLGSETMVRKPDMAPAFLESIQIGEGDHEIYLPQPAIAFQIAI